MGVLHNVVIALSATRVARESVGLAQRIEVRTATGQHLVDVGLVTCVPDDGIVWGAENPMERDRQLNDSQIRPQVTAGCRNLLHKEGPDLARERRQLIRSQCAQIVRAADLIHQGRFAHGPLSLRPDRSSSTRRRDMTTPDSRPPLRRCANLGPAATGGSAGRREGSRRFGSSRLRLECRS